MRIGKEMQFFGARANLAKCLLYAINGGVDEISGKQVGPKYRPITSEYLDYDEVWDKYKDMMKWLASVYVNALNIIHYMHDKYCYERMQMALHDKQVRRWFATGIAGFSVVADSLSAIKYAKVKPIRDENGITVDFEIEGDFPKYGNDDDRVDEIAKEVLHTFIKYVKEITPIAVVSQQLPFLPLHPMYPMVRIQNNPRWKKERCCVCSGCKPNART